MSDNTKLYDGPPLSDRQLAKIFTHVLRWGRAISDPKLHEDLRTGCCGGAYPWSKDHPSLFWQAQKTGIEYTVGGDGVKRLLKWSTLEKMDDAQLDLFEAMGS